jgi:GTP-binding protein
MTEATAPTVVKAEFVTSAPDLSRAPAAFGPEVAICGRSNVGKSSLLNMLTNRKRLVQVSSTPGRTRLLNFFRIGLSGGEELGVVDLPGYGFAKVSEAQRRAFGPMIEGYLLGREELKALVLLIDLRRDPEVEERQIVEFASSRGLALVVLATKSDQVTKAKRRPRQEALKAALGLRRLPVLTSAEGGEGRAEAWSAILAAAFPKPPPAPE